ncbi:MAG: WbqC family protein [Burkholderiales bacterium]|nr:WbqC family protein [Burkholderiales bacterium]
MEVPGASAMRVAIMQPYFFPYIGYFQLMQAVNLFIIHDRVKYAKKGWINRNRILQNGHDAVISLPLKHASDALDIRDREIAADFDRDRLLNRITEAYRRAPHFAQVIPIIERVIRHDDGNLFGFLRNSLLETAGYLGIETRLAAASTFAIDPSLRGQDMVIALCRKAGADVYINAIGGTELYAAAAFRSAGLELNFVRSEPFEYRQLGADFVPWLSIIDVMMFNDANAIRQCLVSNREIFAPS